MAVIEMQDPSKKKLISVETGLEFVPLVGVGIAGKDATLYFKNGQYVAGSVMAAACVVSLASDVGMLFSLGTSKVAGVAGTKSLSALARKFATRALSSDAGEQFITTTVERKVLRELETNPALLANTRAIEQTVAERVNATARAWNARAGKEIISSGAESHIVQGSTDALGNKTAVGLAEKMQTVAQRSTDELEVISRGRPHFAAGSEPTLQRDIVRANHVEVSTTLAKEGSEAAAKRTPSSFITDKAAKAMEAVENVKETAKGAKKFVQDADLLHFSTPLAEKTGAKAAAAGTPPKKAIVWTGEAPKFAGTSVADAGIDLCKAGLGAGKFMAKGKTGTIYRETARWGVDAAEGPEYGGAQPTPRERNEPKF